MAKNLLVISVETKETRVALIENGIIAELHLERSGNKDAGSVGDVVLGKVTRVLPGLQAAFIDIGQERAAFLHVEDLIRPDDFDAYLAGGRRSAKEDTSTSASPEVTGDEELDAELDAELKEAPAPRGEPARRGRRIDACRCGRCGRRGRLGSGRRRGRRGGRAARQLRRARLSRGPGRRGPRRRRGRRQRRERRRAGRRALRRDRGGRHQRRRRRSDGADGRGCRARLRAFREPRGRGRPDGGSRGSGRGARSRRSRTARRPRPRPGSRRRSVRPPRLHDQRPGRPDPEGPRAAARGRPRRRRS